MIFSATLFQNKATVILYAILLWGIALTVTPSLASLNENSIADCKLSNLVLGMGRANGTRILKLKAKFNGTMPSAKLNPSVLVKVVQSDNITATRFQRYKSLKAVQQGLKIVAANWTETGTYFASVSGIYQCDASFLNCSTLGAKSFKSQSFIIKSGALEATGRVRMTSLLAEPVSDGILVRAKLAGLVNAANSTRFLVSVTGSSTLSSLTFSKPSELVKGVSVTPIKSNTDVLVSVAGPLRCTSDKLESCQKITATYSTLEQNVAMS